MVRIVIIVLIAMFIFPTSVFAEPPQTNEPELVTADHGFWYMVFWGTEDDPGVFRHIWQWFYGGVKALAGLVIDGFMACIPDDYMDDFTGLKPYFELANAWIPLDYGFNLLLIYIAFVSSFSVYKIIVKHIPGIG